MATVRETFDVDSRTGSLQQELSLTVEGGSAPKDSVKVVERVHTHHDAGARYVSYFIPASADWGGLSLYVLGRAQETADMLLSTIISMGNPKLRQSMLSAAQFPFTGRVYIYIDADVSDGDVAAICQKGADLGLMVDVRDRTYVRTLDETEAPVAFISHAYDDKEAVAGPIAAGLGSRLVRVWYDEYSLFVGDSLRESINEGLKTCQYCVLVISPALIANRGWAQREFDSIQTREIDEGRKFILPVWHNVERSDVGELALWLADRRAALTSKGIPDVVQQLHRSIARGE